MSANVRAWAAPAPNQPLAPLTIDRREPGAYDVEIEILFCGVCHSDIHQVRDEWGKGIFPMVPGHEIVGRVSRTGPAVTRFKAGDLAGVGCFVDSCLACDPCGRGLEQFCLKGAAFTYNGTEMDRKTPTYGGYSQRIVVKERFTLKVPAGFELSGVAPLLCAGITTYSPLRQWNCKRGDRVGVVGPRRARAHGRQARRRDGRRGHDAQHLALQGGRREAPRRARVRAHEREEHLQEAGRAVRPHRRHDLGPARPERPPRDAPDHGRHGDRRRAARSGRPCPRCPSSSATRSSRAR